MYPNRITIAVWLLLSASPVAAAPADWKYYGFAKFPDANVAVFYLQDDIKQNTSGNYEIWTKGLDRTQLLQAADFSAGKNKSVLRRVATKFTDSYLPPIARVQTLDKDQMVAVVSYEEIADDAKIEPRSRILYEMNCRETMIRELSIFVTSNGQDGNLNGPQEWKHIAPETNAANLAAIICPSR